VAQVKNSFTPVIFKQAPAEMHLLELLGDLPKEGVQRVTYRASLLVCIFFSAKLCQYAQFSQCACVDESLDAHSLVARHEETTNKLQIKVESFFSTHDDAGAIDVADVILSHSLYTP
jgi:hypothetical protein